MAIRVYPGGRVEIVVPEGTAARFVEGFVVRHREWIARKVDEFARMPVPDPQ
ncbi:MAG: YgjP-like metallopeptidase domain-containing protein, partial [Steroidobacteraceae bacterium]